MCEYEKKIPVYDIKIIVDDAILVDSKPSHIMKLCIGKLEESIITLGLVHTI